MKAVVLRENGNADALKLEGIAKLIEAGKVKAHVETVFSLSEIKKLTN